MTLVQEATSRPTTFKEQPLTKTDATKRAAANGLAGLWKDCEDLPTVEETVRNMRKGRGFDT